MSASDRETAGNLSPDPGIRNHNIKMILTFKQPIKESKTTLTTLLPPFYDFQSDVRRHISFARPARGARATERARTADRLESGMARHRQGLLDGAGDGG